MVQAREDDFAIIVRPAQGGWSGALVDLRGMVLPVGAFENADAALAATLIARATALSGLRAA